MVENIRNVLSTCGRKDAHKLFIRFEGLSKFELQLHLAEVFKIASERGKVVWIIPLPGRGSLIIIM